MTRRSSLKTGTRVHLRPSEIYGTVSRIDAGGFTVTYGDDHVKGQPRARHTYPWDKVTQFDTIADILAAEVE